MTKVTASITSEEIKRALKLYDAAMALRREIRKRSREAYFQEYRDRGWFYRRCAKGVDNPDDFVRKVRAVLPDSKVDAAISSHIPEQDMKFINELWNLPWASSSHSIAVDLRRTIGHKDIRIGPDEMHFINVWCGYTPTYVYTYLMQQKESRV